MNKQLQKAFDLFWSSNINEAVAIFQAEVAKNPKNADALAGMGLASAAGKRFADAERFLRTSLQAKKQGHVMAHLGECLLAVGRSEEGYGWLAKGVKKDPKCAKILTSLANTYLQNGDDQTSFKIVDLIIKSGQEAADVLVLKGLQEGRLGRSDAGVGSFMRALELQPENLSALRAIASSEIVPEQSLAERLGTMENRADISRMHKASLWFTLSRVARVQGDVDSQWKYLEQANRAQRATYEYNVEADARDFQLLVDYYENILKGLDIPSAPVRQSPVFIVGMPFSGGGVVEAVLSSHPQAGVVTGLPSWPGMVLQPNGEGAALNSLTRALEAWRPENIQAMGEHYLEAIEESATGIQCVIDPSVDNFIYLGFIKALVPNAKIIHCSRSPLGNCWSIYRRLMNAKILHGYDQYELGMFYRIHRQLMGYWSSCFGDDILRIELGDLIKNPESQVERLLRFCDLDWSDSCLSVFTSEIKEGDVAIELKSASEDLEVQSFLSHLSEMVEILKAE